MKITSAVFEAYLKCPTKCWLRATGEPASGNTYAEWVNAQNASYRATGTARLVAASPHDEVALSPNVENVKAATWRLDVEGLPDRDFCYLIGLRIGSGETAVQHSLWADNVEDEGKIWREFVGILETVEKPVVIHYGSYETTFLRRMSERYGNSHAGPATTGALHSLVNLLSFIFARVYFPTYSNGLKDVAGWCGYKWSGKDPSGLTAISLRHDWEQLRADSKRQRLIAYNGEDCAALESLASPLMLLARQSGIYSDADLVDVPKTPATKHGRELHRCLNSALKSAHWIYKQKKISLRTAENGKSNELCIHLRPTQASERRCLENFVKVLRSISTRRKLTFLELNRSSGY